MYYLIIAAAVTVTAVLVWINYGFKITEHTLEYNNLPQAFDGYRIVLISDLHDATFGRANARLIQAIDAISPDCVMMVGDMHEKSSSDQEFLTFLTDLCEKFPVYAVDGNHEKYWHNRDDYGEYLQKYLSTGVKHLEGTSELIKKDGQSIRVYGRGYHQYRDGDGENDGEYFSVALLHIPDWIDRIEAKPDLMLSGHVHGGIIRLPFIGGILAPGYGATLIERLDKKYFFPKYSKGVYSCGNSNLVVTVGLGKASVQPFRLLRPEITVITLKTGEKH